MHAHTPRRRLAAILPAVCCLCLTLLAGCAAQAPQTDVAEAPAATEAAGTVATASHGADAEQIERGRYLVAFGGCNDCHTPWVMGENGPEPDMSRYLSGHPEGMELSPAPALAGTWGWAGTGTNTAYAGPWGVSYAMNLTPDENTGLGIWTEEMFIQAIRTGKHMGQSRPINPPMPWPAYRNATDEDLKAIFAYLRSIKPIKNRIPEYQPPAPAPIQAAG